MANLKAKKKTGKLRLKKKLAKNWRIEVKSKIRRKSLCVRSHRVKNCPKKGQIAKKKKLANQKIKKNWQKTGEQK